MIRPAELSDAAAIQEINATALGYDFGLIETFQKLSELLDRSDHFILVAENAAGQIVGYTHTCRYDCLYFSSLLLAVAPDFQGQGYGKALMQAVREKGSATGYAGIRINSGISRTAAHEFYRKLGCEEKADQKRFYWEF
ncbi:putative acetyltransferase [Streptococcus constellatus]|uniref:Putative acetyltransferase n=1 Tax=Streptococcus constellatus TaxID=76860 RepID=A0A564TNY8_STRCV|nr:GNAT family N-acetyltransferase [Streptococcus constellatus]VUX02501.1 putative acetyltransferase [Streptococcus gordonii]VUX08911.1 putative acetyltransferase [Streptococcus constellatus]